MKMIKLVEVHLPDAISTKAFSRKDVVETRTYSLREIFLNPLRVIMIRAWSAPGQGYSLPKNLDSRQEYSHVEIESGLHAKSLILVGSPGDVQKKLGKFHET